MSANEGSLRSWLAKRKSSVALALAAVLAGMILLNPALVDLGAAPPSQTARGPVFHSILDKDSFEITLYLVSYDERRDQILPAPIKSRYVSIFQVANRSQCNVEHAAAFVGAASSAYRGKPADITRIRPPVDLAKFKLPKDYIGRYACFIVRMRDEHGVGRDHYHASIRRITGPILVFDHDFDQGPTEDTVASKFKLRSYNGRSSNLPAKATAWLFESRIKKKSDCTRGSDNGYIPGDGTLPLQELLDSGHKSLYLLGSGPFYGCYKVLLDPDGDGKDRLEYYYVTSSLPRYSGEDTAVEARQLVIPEDITPAELLAIFKDQLTEEGLATLATVEVIPHSNGCAGWEDRDISTGGCWEHENRFLYINAAYFDLDYQQLYPKEKIDRWERAMNTLTHELLHVTASDMGSIYLTMNECYEDNRGTATFIKHRLTWMFGSDERWLSYAERPSDAVEECWWNHPTWGAIAKSMVEAYETHGSDNVPDIAAGWAYSSSEEIELFSPKWYTEFYAELPEYTIDLSEPLINQYQRFFKEDFLDARRDAVIKSLDQRYGDAQ